MVAVAGVAGARRRRPGVDVVRVAHCQRLARAADARHRRGARRLCGAGIGHVCRASHRRRRAGLSDGEVLRIASASVVGVAGVAGARRRRPGVGVIRVAHGQRQVQPAHARDGCRAGRLRRAGIGHARRAGNRRGRARLGDREGLRVAAANVVGVAGEGRASSRRPGVRVVRVGDSE